MTCATETRAAIPLHFVAQIDLSALPWQPSLPKMPRDGTLLFFVDLVYGPRDEFGSGSFAVLHLTEDLSDCAPRQMPDGLPDPETDPEASMSYRDFPTAGLQHWPFTVEPRVSYDRHAVSGEMVARQLDDLNFDEVRRLEDLCEADWRNGDDNPQQNSGFSQHSMFAGPSSPVQVVSGKTTFLTDAIPLLSVQDDPDIGTYLDLGDFDLVFWIEEAALERGDFAKVWVLEGMS